MDNHPIAPHAAMREFDLRTLPAPEPMQRALALADTLAAGESVAVLTPLLPTPLLDALARRGLHSRARSLPDGGARIVITDPRSPHDRDADGNGADRT